MHEVKVPVCDNAYCLLTCRWNIYPLADRGLVESSQWAECPAHRTLLQDLKSEGIDSAGKTEPKSGNKRGGQR
jgi:hypothetical protein